MERFILQSIGAASFGGVLIFMLACAARNWFLARLKNSIKYEYERDLKRLDDELRKKTDTELARVNATLSMEVEMAKLRMGPYSEKQFVLYNELWISLCDLKHSMELLWDHASEENVRDFANKLAQASRKLEQSALLVEPNHYQELNEILNQFGDYRLGKQTLIEVSQDRVIGNPIQNSEIRQLVSRNGVTRQHLRKYLPQMMDCLRSQIAGIKSGANKASEDIGSGAPKPQR